MFVGAHWPRGVVPCLPDDGAHRVAAQAQPPGNLPQPPSLPGGAGKRPYACPFRSWSCLKVFKKARERLRSPAAQQMGLRVKGAAFQPPVLAFAHHPLHVLLRQFQVASKTRSKSLHPRDSAAPAASVPAAAPVALEDFLAQRLRSAKTAVRQLLTSRTLKPLPLEASTNSSIALGLPRLCAYNGAIGTCRRTRERPRQRVLAAPVRSSRSSVPGVRSPRLCSGKVRWRFPPRHLARVLKFRDEGRLLQNAQYPLVGSAQQPHNRHRLILSQRPWAPWPGAVCARSVSA